MSAITNHLLNAVRQRIASVCDHGRYQENSAWYTANIYKAEIQDNGSVTVSFYVDRQDSADSASDFQLCDAEGNVLAEREETVAFSAGLNRILYRFRFGVAVVEPEAEAQEEEQEQEE